MKKGTIKALETNQTIADYIAERSDEKADKDAVLAIHGETHEVFDLSGTEDEAYTAGVEQATNGIVEEISFVGIVSDRDTLDEALEYFLEIIKSMPKEDQFPVNMALQLVLNTLSKNYLVIKKGGK